MPRSERGKRRGVARPLQEFLQTEAAGGTLLLGAAALALAWANLWPASYGRVWSTEITLGVGTWSIAEDLRHWVNDALMAVFFFVAGLEIKRELVAGELRDPRAAALPAFGAIGGMIVPALIYAAINAGGAGSRGWGIPMATDIAFAIGVLALVGRRLPPGLKLFLLTLAIVDDLGAIIVIAVFYSSGISWTALATAAGLLCVVWMLRRAGVRAAALYAALGVGTWVAVYASGVHATLAGVALGLLTPAVPRTGRTTAPLDRLEQALHPWTSFVVVPLFALANAGVYLGGGALGAAVSSPITIGIIAGLVLGKTLGIALLAWVGVRSGLARLPAGSGWGHLIGVSAVAGIGFTVSLFIAALAFPSGTALAAAKVGILTASLGAGVVGAAALRSSSSDPQDPS